MARTGFLPTHVSVDYGPLVLVPAVYSYLAVLAGIGILIRHGIRRFRLYRLQAVFILLAAIPPVVGSVIDTFLLLSAGTPASPFGYLLMCLFFGAALFRHRFLEIVPIAREQVIESMADPMVVLDGGDRIVDLNPAAQRLLGIKVPDVIGRALEEITGPWPDLLTQGLAPKSPQQEISIEGSGEARFYDLLFSPLYGRRGRGAGRVVVMRDVTQRRQAERKLEESLATVEALKEKLYEQAIRDPLTGLYSRRFLAEATSKELSRAARQNRPVCFAMLDIDFFKNVNDAHGHDAGDEVLKDVARVLLEQSRATDYIFRYGGEEFLILMPDTDPQAAGSWTERWRKAVEESAVYYDGHRLSVTISLGVAVWHPGGPGVEHVLKLADKALYEANATGRNKVVLSSHP